jgi:RNA polymerase sigma-70 factor (ECF subfamily)
MSRLADEYAKAGKSRLFMRVRPALTGDSAGISYAEIASELHISSEAVKMAVSRLRKHYRELLRQTIADTVSSPRDIDDEIRHLFDALSG